MAKSGEADALPAKDAGVNDISLTGQSLVQLGKDFAQAMRAKGDPAKGMPADKKFIDSLYEDEDGDGNFDQTDIELA
jgi:hypothetical protein